MADAQFFPYQTGVPVKLVPLGDGTYAAASWLSSPVTISGTVTVSGTVGVSSLPPITGTVTVSSLPAITGTVAVSSVTTLPQGVYEVSQTPTVTAGTYAANVVMGGIMTFPLILTANSQYGGILESITVKFKASVQTAAINVAIFSASPAGTFTNGNTAAIASADSALLLGIYQLTSASSVLGTHTVYNLDGIAKALIGTSTSLFVVVVPSATTAALATTSDMIVTLGILGG